MSRLTGARILLAVATVLGVLSILSIWISRQVLENDQWTRTSSQLLEKAAVRTAVSGFLVDQLYAHVDVAGELRSVLPSRFDALAAPAAGALRTQAQNVAEQALGRPEVQQAWQDANRAAQAELIDFVVHGGGKVLAHDQGVVTLDLKALLQELQRRIGIGGRIAGALPADAAKITILRSDQLKTAQTVGRLLKPLALVLTLLFLACLGAAIALARGHRRQMVRASGVVLILAGAITLVVRRFGGDAVVSQLAATAAVRPAVADVWSVGTSLLTGVATATIAYGALAVIGAWLAGPTTVAVRIRSAIGPYASDWRIAYAVAAAVVLLVLIWGPTEGTRRPLPALVLTALFGLGVEVFRRQIAAEHAADAAAAGDITWTHTPPEPAPPAPTPTVGQRSTP